jgi:hypothetical protein
MSDSDLSKSPCITAAHVAADTLGPTPGEMNARPKLLFDPIQEPG